MSGQPRARKSPEPTQEEVAGLVRALEAAGFVLEPSGRYSGTLTNVRTLLWICEGAPLSLKNPSKHMEHGETQ